MNLQTRPAIARRIRQQIAHDAYLRQRELRMVEGPCFLRDPEAERAILEDWRYAWLYSRDVLRHRWPDFEARMAMASAVSDPSEVRAVYNYARYVVGGRLEAAEHHLAGSAEAALDYARDVLGHVWREGMPLAKQANAAIARHPTASTAYRTEMGIR